MGQPNRLAILVGGGPAPGINSVIGAATIRSRLAGVGVIGIRNGFQEIMAGDLSGAHPLGIEDVSRIHFRGGSVLGTSRANPTTDPALLETTVRSLLKLGVSQLVTIGGDDTAFSAMQLTRKAEGRIRTVHVPKTIDNDLDLPPHIDTFGYQTARHVGVGIVQNLMMDAKTTSRWYFVVTMGRKAGHLALGIGKSAGATITLIPEEWGEAPVPVPLRTVVDSLVGSMIQRLAAGRRDGVAVIAEGLALHIAPEDLGELADVERDEHGHVRIAEVNLGEILRAQVARRLAGFGLKATTVAKNIGYELRSADPVPADMEYTRDLGFCAARHLLAGGNADLVSIDAGQFVPIPFDDLIDRKQGRFRVRLVDFWSTRYRIAHRYMLRLRREDFDDARQLSQLAATVGISPEEFRQEFGYLTRHEPVPLHFPSPADAGEAAPA